MITSHRARGLSLVETVVVVAIIVILAAIISVAIRSGIVAAKNAGCISNLSQVGKATELYATDNSMHLPPFYTDNRADEKGGPHKQDVASFFGAMKAYGATSSVLYCPLDDAKGQVVAHGVELSDHTVSSYEVSLYVSLFADKSKAYLNFALGNVADPARTMYLFDKGWNEGSRTEWVTAHGKSQNTLFFDWHVARRHTHLPVCVWPAQSKDCENED